MKKEFFSLVLILLSIFIISCSRDKDKTDEGTKKYLKGVAAVGAVLPQGSKVELRSAPVNGVPSEIITSSVQDGQGNYSIDVTGLTEPYLIRVEDAPRGVWYYSFTDAAQNIANVNPLTDAVVRSFYMRSKFVSCMIDYIWDDGFYNTGCVYTDTGVPVPIGTAVVFPTNQDISNIVSPLINCLSLWYNIAFTTDLFTTEWKVGEGFDYVLDQLGVNVSWAYTITDSAAQNLGDMESYYVYTTVESGRSYFNCKVLSKRDSIEIMSVAAGSDAVLTVTSTDSEGVKTFEKKIDVTDWFNEPSNIADGVTLENYNLVPFSVNGNTSDAYFCVVIHK